jgi:hypothetical protein
MFLVDGLGGFLSTLFEREKGQEKKRKKKKQDDGGENSSGYMCRGALSPHEFLERAHMVSLLFPAGSGHI